MKWVQTYIEEDMSDEEMDDAVVDDERERHWSINF